MVIISKKEYCKTRHYNWCEYLDFIFVKKKQKSFRPVHNQPDNFVNIGG